MSKTEPASARELIDRWATHGEMATDLGVHFWRVAKWYQRNSIPPEHWEAVIRAAEKRQFKDISLELLMRFRSAA